MATPRTHRVPMISLAALAMLFLAGREVFACPFCTEQRGPTLVGKYNEAAMVLVGTFTNSRPNAQGDVEGTSDFVIDEVLKSHEILGKKKTLTLPKYVTDEKSKYIIFCDVYKMRIDPYHGVPVQPGSDLVKYLRGATKLKDEPLAVRLRYAFDYLNSSETEVAIDAYREFQRADYKDYKDMARKLPAETLAKWLRDPNTPSYRYGLYGSLLGLCGGAEDAKLLRAMVQGPQKRTFSGVDGLLVGSVTIQPKEGWANLKEVLKDEKLDFQVRYAALRAVRFLWDLRPDLVAKKDLVEGMSVLLDDPHMADLAIEDLRKWQRWEMTGRILELFTKESHNIPIVKGAILRFALSSPQPRAAAFVEEQRRRDRPWVTDTEELLHMEAHPPGLPPALTK